MTDELSAPGGAREHGHEEKRLDWRSVVDGMTDIQKKVHLSMRHTDDDTRVWRETLMKQVRDNYAETIRQEVIGMGCPDPGRVYVRESAELREIAAHVGEVARGIVNTYNYDLAHAIRRIGEETPTANRNVYASRLWAWEAARDDRKNAQIGETETGWAVNMAKQAFHAHNAEIPARAEVRPYPSVCPVCQEYIRGNPYSSMDALYRKCNLPAHIGCPHHAVALTDRKPTREECRGLWTGG